MPSPGSAAASRARTVVKLVLPKEGSNNVTQANPSTMPRNGDAPGRIPTLEPDPSGNDPIGQPVNGNEGVEGLDSSSPGSWGDYPIDELLIRNEGRTIYEVSRRIDQGTYIMDPDFQRDFIWKENKQSRLIESVIMRIPLPVFYLAENQEGKIIIVDGLQRLSTFQQFLKNKLRLKLPDQEDLHRKYFKDLPPKLQNRVEDFNLIFYIIDSKLPERAQLDIFERVNDGVPLTRQQMRNCLYMGKGTRFLKDASKSETFLKATGNSLKSETMRDREFINRFCAFQLLGPDSYNGDMDKFLATCLKHMNKMEELHLSQLSEELQRGLSNNHILFDRHAFRKHRPNQRNRNPINASLWDVMSTGLSRHQADHVQAHADPLRQAIYKLLADEKFDEAISLGTNGTRSVRDRFQKAQHAIQEVLE